MISIKCYLQQNNGGEFNWDSETKGLILGSFYWGYILTQIPGGILAERFGGKWICAIGLLLTNFFCLITPVSARQGGPGFLVAIRVLTGLSEAGITHYFLYDSMPT